MMFHIVFTLIVKQSQLILFSRKLVSATCILLAAKISSDLKKLEVKHLIDVRHTHTHILSVSWAFTCLGDLPEECLTFLGHHMHVNLLIST